MDFSDRVDEAFDLDVQELQDELPPLIELLEENVVHLVENRKELLPRLFDKMQELDVSELSVEAPDVVDQFQGFLWKATEELIRRDELIQDKINTDCTVNYEATDSPMSGHLEMVDDEGVIRGGGSTVDDADLTIRGDTNSLVELLVGEVDPVQGFLGGQFTMDGPPSLGVELAPILKGITDRYKSY